MFSMNDSVYGAVFFSLTGLHGVHVYLGVMFLLFGLLVNLRKNLSKSYFNSEDEYDEFLGRYNSTGLF
jgi:heme/copper-type cytochrome/quinol oxidase subunit 3